MRVITLLAMFVTAVSGAAWTSSYKLDLKPSGGDLPIVKSAGKDYHTGFKPTPGMYDRAQFRHFPPYEGATAGDPTPLEFSLEDQCGKLPVENQGSCGSCWWFSSKGTMEDHIQCADKKDGMDLVSGQWGTDCSGFGSCGGGDLALESFMDPKGAVYTAEYGPYLASNRRCNSSKVAYHEQGIEQGYVRSVSGGKPEVQDIQRAIMETGTVAICGSAGALGGGGWVTRVIGGSTNHCYRVVGWKDGKTNGKPAGVYWDIINSWDTSWGDGGHAYVISGRDGITLAGSVLTEAKYLTYKPMCTPQPKADAGPMQNIIMAVGHSHQATIGTAALPDTSYTWLPSEGVVSGGGLAQAVVSPAKTTTYTVTAVTKCGKAVSTVAVHVFNKVINAKGVMMLREVK